MAPQCVAGLETLLREAGLPELIPAAAEWCELMGPRDLEEIAEDEVFDSFAQALLLKPLQLRRLRKALPGGGAPGAVAPIEAPQLQSVAQFSPTVRVPAKVDFSMPDPGATVFVKNTFLDLHEGPQAVDLRRLQTEPPQKSDALACLEELLAGSSGGDEPDSFKADGGSEEHEETEDGTEAPTDGLTNLYKTVTCDGYEPINSWSWAGGDPNVPTVPEDDEDQDAGSLRDAGQNMVGMLMVPVDAMPGYNVPLSSSSGMHFPGCVAVPVDRFSRWPGQADESGEQPWRSREEAAAHAAALAAAAADEAPKRPQVLQRAFSVASSIYRIRWTVDARKLVSSDREHVSPSFELSFAGNVQFKMIMRPKVMSSEKGGSSFKKARGRGKVVLRCLEDVEGNSARPVVSFRIAVGNPHKSAAPRGPVRHDFSESPVVGLPEAIQQWDFTKAVDKSTHTFVICLEVLSGAP